MKLITHPFDGGKKELRELIKNMDLAFELVHPAQHKIYEGKQLNNRNFIQSARKRMHNEKSYFGTQNGSLATCHLGVVTIEQCEPAQ